MTASESARGDWRDGLPEEVDREALPAPARAIEHDTRRVRPGDVFVCLVGERIDSHELAGEAVEAGAIALVVDAGRAAELGSLGVPVVETPDSRRALASIAAAHEGFPGRQLTVVGITGTNGKSTTAFLTVAALEACGAKVGLLSTIESRIDGRVIENESRLSSPEAPVVQRLLAEMVEAGCTHAVVEATSHGLDRHRVAEVGFDVAVLTNLTGDHLDYHGTFQKYRRAKARLFEALSGGAHGQSPGFAILNADDPHWQHFEQATRARVATYAIDNPEADVRAEEISLWPDGSTWLLATAEETLEASVRLPGRFNVANATAAITVAAALGFDAGLAASGVANCAGVPGRMERIEGAPFTVVVDYAHTGDALRAVIEALRPVVEGRLIVVFGAAGERAQERRAALGRVAAELADLAVLTDEDPRGEPSEAIIGEIAEAMIAAGAVEGERFERVANRRTAIDRAFAVARPGDLVLLAGKGHESSIEYAEGPRPWDERAVARELIAERFS